MEIKLPQVSIQVTNKQGDDSTSGKLSILSIGFGIHQAWIYAAMFGAGTIFESETIVLASKHMHFEFVPSTLVFLISIIVFGLTLLFLSFTDQKYLKFYVSKAVLIASGILTSISTLAVFLANTETALGWIALLFAGIGTGIGSALLLIEWGTAFSRHSSGTIVVNTAIAILVAIAIYSTILHGLSRPFSGIATAVLPLLELFFLWRLTPIPYSKRHEVPIFNPLPVKRGPFVLSFGVPVLIFGFALGFLRSVSMQHVLPTINTESLFTVCIAAAIAMGITMILIFTTGNENHHDYLFKSIIPFIVVAILALPFLGDDNVFVVNIILLVGYMAFEALMWIFFGSLSQTFRLSPIFVFGLGRGLLAIGSIAGSMIVLYVPYLSFMEVSGRAGGAILMLLTMVIAYMLLPRQREIATMVDPHTHFPEENDVAILNEEAAQQGSTVDALPESDSDGGKKGGRFRRQCETIADRYLLSRRETEVMFLLAKGHKATFIQEKLCISRSTAKTHISHIYRKLDIHTQQELLNMLENMKDEDINDHAVRSR